MSKQVENLYPFHLTNYLYQSETENGKVNPWAVKSEAGAPKVSVLLRAGCVSLLAQ